MSVEDAGLSDRGRENYEPGSMRFRFAALRLNPWHAETNPNGFVNLGISENVSRAIYGRVVEITFVVLSSSHYLASNDIRTIPEIIRVGLRIPSKVSNY